MKTPETQEDREARRQKSRIAKMESDPEFLKVKAEIINNHKSTAHKRIEEARRKCTERREKRERLTAAAECRMARTGRADGRA